MDCSVEFTKSSRAVSIVIALNCDVPEAIPLAVYDAPKPLPAFWRAVNPWISQRPSRTILPISAAVLHTPTTSLESSGMPLCKHATCSRRMQEPNCIRRKIPAGRVACTTPSLLMAPARPRRR